MMSMSNFKHALLFFANMTSRNYYQLFLSISQRNSYFVGILLYVWGLYWMIDIFLPSKMGRGKNIPYVGRMHMCTLCRYSIYWAIEQVENKLTTQV